MVDYFEPNQKEYLGRPRMTLPHRLHMDLQPINNDALSGLAMNRLQWKNIGDLDTFRFAAQVRAR